MSRNCCWSNSDILILWLFPDFTICTRTRWGVAVTVAQSWPSWGRIQAHTHLCSRLLGLGTAQPMDFWPSFDIHKIWTRYSCCSPLKVCQVWKNQHSVRWGNSLLLLGLQVLSSAVLSVSARVTSCTTNSLLCLLPSQNFYNQVSTPLLKKIQFNYPRESVSDVTQSSFHNYFGGSEIVVAGKVDTENLQHLQSVVTATAVSEGVPGTPAQGFWAGPFHPVCSLPAEG